MAQALPSATNSRVIPITSNKKFKRAGIVDIFTKIEPGCPSEVSICAVCGFGSQPQHNWYPVLETSCCPVCGSSKKR
ncbi:hypothetical protein SAMN05660649_02877 [Desulfotomaculum arcticum]|uniref:Uncharacterized protein n=1 Tax=Desulfotruncus arcticus DSM 17038 TaxID=1121424 RepID=A0A1I2V333_9FIRM|nr:hypothetical protein [Desulfotruncus arcticus]SFG83748.1 hypothetical protein SAMN05660649_02877 [Desulfotomaculum arcticum] [Desulfotruncus arcticus DSM 17038]